MKLGLVRAQAAHGAYVVAPGSAHRSGAVYRAFVGGFGDHGPRGPVSLDELAALLSIDWLRAHVPVFPLEVHEREVQRALERREWARCARHEIHSAPSQLFGGECINGTTVTPRGDDLPTDLVLHGADGTSRAASTLRSGEKFRCRCPWREDRNPSAFAAVCQVGLRAGRVFVFDSGSGETRWISAGQVRHEEARLEVQLEEVPLETAHLGPGEPDETIHLDAEGYLGHQLADLDDLLPQGGLVVLDAGLSAGKTRWARDQSYKVDRLVAITPGIALTGNLATEFRATEYTDDGAKLATRVATTTHSSPKIPVWVDSDLQGEIGLEAFARDLCVIDEADQVREAWHSDLVRGFGTQTKEATLAHLAAAKWGVVATADFTNDEIAWWVRAYRARRPGARVVVLRKARPAATRSITLVRESVLREKFDAALDAHGPGDGPIVLQVTSDAAPQEEAARIARRWPHLRVWWTSSRNSSEPSVRAALRDPNEIVRTHDVILASPTIASGLSVTEPVSQVFLLAPAKLPAKALGQMLMRWRRPLRTDVMVALPARRGDWRLDAEYLRRVALGLEARTRATIATAQVQWRLDWRTEQRVPNDEEFLASWVLAEQERRRNANDSLREFAAVARRHGWEVHDERDLRAAPDPTRARERREARAEVDQRWASRVASSRDLDEEEAETLIRRYELAPEDRAAVEKEKLRSFYGRDVTSDLVAIDDRGKKRRQVRAFVLLRLWQSGARLATYSTFLDRLSAHGRDGAASRHATELRHHHLRARLQDRVASVLLGGMRIDRADGVTLTSADLIARAKTLIASKRSRDTIGELLGSRPTEATLRNPTRWALSFLRSIGVEIEGPEQRRVAGERTRYYTLRVGRLLDLARAELRRAVQDLHDARLPEREQQVANLVPLHIALKEIEDALARIIAA